jgi:hypothetical protein
MSCLLGRRQRACFVDRPPTPPYYPAMHFPSVAASQRSRLSMASLAALASAAFLFAASPAHAQQPVCDPVAAGEPVVTVCRSASLFPAVRFLADFTVDQLFKPAPPAFERTALGIADVFVPRETSDKSLRKILGALAPIRFLQLDRTTGSLVADWTDGEHEARTKLSGMFGELSVTLRLPNVLEGGYWRGPDVLQIALWKRIGVHVDSTDGTTFDSDVSCLSLSPEQLVVRFAAAGVPPLVVQFRECTP